MKKFWWGMAGFGVIVFVAGLILTIVLINETGEKRPDSECGSMRASVLATCVVSDDPKVLLGIAPLLLGLTMIGLGVWWGIVTPAPSPVTPPASSDPPPGLGSSRSIEE